MAYDNSNVEEESLLDSISETDPDGQQFEDAEDTTSDVDNKFVTKTSQKLSDIEQILALALKGNKKIIQELSNDHPELAQRLQRKKRYSHLFDEDEVQTEAEIPSAGKNELIQALRLIEIDGKMLPSVDIKKLQGDNKFMKKYNALIKGGYDSFEAAEDAFSSVFPGHNNKGSSILSRPSEEVPYKAPLPPLTDKEKKLARSAGLTEEEAQRAKMMEG